MSEPRPHTMAERGLDVYETEDVAIAALIKHEALPHHIREPACGPGKIVKALRAAGHTVWATDILDHGCPDSFGDVDFLATTQTRIDTEAIVTNPPYGRGLAGKFAAHALDMCPRVYMLMRLAFLEGHRKQRSAILDGGRLARVLVFRNRLPMMHRAGWDGPKATSRIPFAWFVWDRDHVGDAIMRRISWEKPAPAPITAELRAALLAGLEEAA